MSTTKKSEKSQPQKFREAARAHECDEDEGRFDATLKAVSGPLKKPQKDAPGDRGDEAGNKRKR
jgi:hypothetical protein